MANPETTPSIEQAIRWAGAELQGSDSPLLDARALLSGLLQQSLSWLLTWPEKPLSEAQWQQYQAWLARRKQGEPVAYILGQREFWSLPLEVEPSTLIPRPDTETLIEAVLELDLPTRGKALDLGTGTGAIALALASEQADWQWWAVDQSAAAVALAQRNCQRLNFDNRVTVLQSDWFSALSGMRFQLIVSNPPYIETDDPHLLQGDVRFEPASALTSGTDGLDDIRIICQQAPDYLEAGGWLLLEHGYNQAYAVAEIMRQQGFSAITCYRDLGGQQRITAGCFAAVE